MTKPVEVFVVFSLLSSTFFAGMTGVVPGATSRVVSLDRNSLSSLRPRQLREVLPADTSIPIMIKRQVQVGPGGVAGAANIPNKLALSDSFPT